MEQLRRDVLGRVLAPGTELAGALAAGFASYLLLFTRDWRLTALGGLPFAPCWLALTAIAIGRGVGRTRRVDGRSLLVGGVVAAAVLVDATLVPSEALRDWHLDLRAGERWLAHENVYPVAVLSVAPADPKDYPFLYPPPTVPIFAAFARLPPGVADTVIVIGFVAATCLALRLLGVRTRWWPAFFAWTPVFLGLWVGNVVILVLLLYVAGMRFGPSLVLAGMPKPQVALVSLWLVRERQFRALAVGLTLLLAWIAVTVPLTTLELWREWLAGLAIERQSQRVLPDLLAYLALVRFVPEVVAAALALIVLVAALAVRGRESLARLGVASIVASPSVYVHGATLGLPAILSLRREWMWLVIGLTSFVPATPFWPAIGLVIASWYVPALRDTDDERTGERSIDVVRDARGGRRHGAASTGDPPATKARWSSPNL